MLLDHPTVSEYLGMTESFITSRNLRAFINPYPWSIELIQMQEICQRYTGAGVCPNHRELQKPAELEDSPCLMARGFSKKIALLLLFS